MAEFCARSPSIALSTLSLLCLSLGACSAGGGATGPDGTGGAASGPANSGGAGMGDGDAAGGSGEPGTGAAAGVGGTGAGGSPGGTGGVSSTGGTTANGDCSNLPVCDDLEAGAAGWTANGNGNTALTVAPGRTGNGLHAAGNVSFIENKTVIAGSTTGKVHVRAYMNWDAVLASGHVAYITLAPDDDSLGQDLRFGSQNGFLHLNSPAGGDGLYPSPYAQPCVGCVAITPGTWNCVEVMFDWTNKTATVWLDDVEQISAGEVPYHNGSMAVWPTPARIRIGTNQFGGENSLTYDDIAIGYDRIGCE